MGILHQRKKDITVPESMSVSVNTPLMCANGFCNIDVVFSYAQYL